MDIRYLGSYIQKVADDACKLENLAPEDVKWQYLIIGDNMLFVICSSYIKLSRRIVYRLWKNTEKNFGLKFHFLRPPKMRICSIAEQNVMFDTYHGIDPYYSICKWNIFGKEHTVLAFKEYFPNDQIDPEFMEKLTAVGFDNSPANTDWRNNKAIIESSWRSFEDAYKAVYGKTPLEEFTERITATAAGAI